MCCSINKIVMTDFIYIDLDLFLFTKKRQTPAKTSHSDL